MPPRERPSSEKGNQAARRAVKGATDEIKAAYKECRTHAAERKFMEEWCKGRNFDFATTFKSYGKNSRRVGRRKGAWMTEVQIQKDTLGGKRRLEKL
eukprot:4928838-Alexandrium_andersonii.AAC.1